MGGPTVAVQAVAGEVAVRAETTADGGRLMLIWPMSVTAELAVAGNRASLRFGRELDGDIAPAAPRLAEWLRGVEAGPAANGLTLHLRDGVGVRLAKFHPRLTVIELFREQPRSATPIGAAMEAAATPHRFIPIPVSRPTMEPATLPSNEAAVASAGVAPGQRAGHDGDPETAAPADAPAAKVTVLGHVQAHGAELRFDWGAAVPAAVFQHRDELWLVFGAAGAEVAGWRSLSRPELAAWLSPETTRNAGEARLFRLKLNRLVHISVRREATDWIVQLTAADRTRRPDGSADLLRRDVAAGTLRAAVDGRVARLNDPTTGERIGVLLTTRADVRQDVPVRLVDLELLASAQGLAWRPLADDVRGRVADGEFVLTRRGGLRLSGTVTDAAAGPASLRVPDHAGSVGGEHMGEPVERASERSGFPPAPLGLSALASTTSAQRQRERHDLVAGLAALRGARQSLARLELARLYLADALGPEARTALAPVRDETLAGPALNRARHRRAALTGAAAALSGQTDTALAILLDRLLDRDPEVALWRAYAAARAQRSELAAQELERSNGALDQYPAPLRLALGLELASTLLDRGDVRPATALLEGLRPLDFPAAMKGRLHVLAGLAMAAAGKPAEAERELQAAAAGDLDTRTRAAFLRISMPAARGEMPPAAAAEAMTALRAGWRGHPWEARMLGRLADLQTRAGRDDDALATLAAAAAHTPDPAAAAGIKSDLGRRVRQMLRAGDSIETAPIATLARYRTYGDYLGGGERDDAALRARLALSAAANGMLTTAAALVDSTIGTAGSSGNAEVELGIARAEAARGDIRGALECLGRSDGETAGAQAGKAVLRGELRARLALDAGNPGAAMAALADLPADMAAPLRRQALFQAGDWAGLAESSAGDDGVTPGGAASAERALWLSLAQAQLGHADLAAAVAARHGPQADRSTAALLELAATIPEEPGSVRRLPTAVGLFAGRLRAALDALPTAPGT